MFQVADAFGVGEACEGAGDCGGDARVAFAEAFDVCFVEDGFFPRGLRQCVVAPVEGVGADDDAFRGVGGVVFAVLPVEAFRRFCLSQHWPKPSVVSVAIDYA